MDAVTAFLIENDMNGVEVKESENTLGCDGVQQCEVTFSNVELGEGKYFTGLFNVLFLQLRINHILPTFTMFLNL